MNAMESVLAFLQITVSLAFVLFLTYWCTRYLIPKLQGGRLGSPANMQVLERLPMGVRSSLCLVRVGSRYVVVGVTPTGIEYVTEVDSEDLLLKDPSAVSVSEFASMLKASTSKVRFFGRRVGEFTGDDNEAEM